jgi:hypothetical protein
MKRRSWKVLVAGIALVQMLVIGVDTALWPIPCEAEQWAERIRDGLTESQEFELDRDYVGAKESIGGWRFFYRFADGSQMTIKGSTGSAHTDPPPPVHPLIRLRRALARVVPSLKV